MKTRRILLVALLAMAVVMGFATTAGAAPAKPHFVTQALGRLDHSAFDLDLVEGIAYDPYFTGVPGHYEPVLASGYIDVLIEAESIGSATGPIYDGTSYAPKWRYKAKGSVTAKVDITLEDGTPVVATVKAAVKKITVCGGARTYFLDVRCKGKPYTMYVGISAYKGYRSVYMPCLGDIMGDPDGIYHAPLISTTGDFHFDFDDPDVAMLPW